MPGSNGSVVRIRLLKDIQDTVTVFFEGDVLCVPKRAAAVLVREGIAVYAEPERAVIAPQETR